MLRRSRCRKIQNGRGGGAWGFQGLFSMSRAMFEVITVIIHRFLAEVQNTYTFFLMISILQPHPGWFFFLYVKKTEGPRANNGCASAFFNTRLSKSGDLMAKCHNFKGSMTPTTFEAYCFYTKKDRLLRLAPF